MTAFLTHGIAAGQIGNDGKPPERLFAVLRANRSSRPSSDVHDRAEGIDNVVPTDRPVSEKAAIRDQTAGHADDRMSSVRRAASFPLSEIGGIEPLQ
jgi:hypothetical protein